MTFRVIFTRQAENDFDEIIGYIRDELCNQNAAKRFYLEVDKKRQLLSEYPYMFPLYHDEKLNEKGYHIAVIDNFLMFYLVDEKNLKVIIVRILYGKQDILSIFQDTDFEDID